MINRLNINRFQPRFAELVNAYMNKHNLTQRKMANIVGVPAPNLNATLRGKRTLTGVTLLPFLVMGVMRVKDIYDGSAKPGSTEHRFWKSAEASERLGLLDKITQLEELGMDVDTMLDMLLLQKKNEK